MNKRPGYASTFIIECSINPQINVEQVKRDKMLGNFYIRILTLVAISTKVTLIASLCVKLS